MEEIEIKISSSEISNNTNSILYKVESWNIRVLPN